LNDTQKHWEHVHHLTLQLEFNDNHVATLGEVSGGRACIELEVELYKYFAEATSLPEFNVLG